MHIIWRRQSCFQIIAARGRGEQVSIVINPFLKEGDLKLPRFQTDILLLSSCHYDRKDLKVISGDSFLVAGPGEYEIKEVFIRGISSCRDNCQEKERKNTIYTIEAEGIKLCHLGDFSQKELTPDQLQEIGDVDILMIPVGGLHTISPKEAQKVTSQIEPQIVIPMNYQISRLKTKPEGLDRFLKVMGQKSIASQPKLLIKKRDLSEERMKVVVLKP